MSCFYFFRCVGGGEDTPSKSWKVHTIEFILGKAFSENHDLTAGEHYAVNVVDQLGVRTVAALLGDIMAWQMIPVSPKDEYSWKRSSELLVEVARHGEESGHGVPSLIG
ncbi:mitochondrial Rho GTPase [Salix suchowensis]|nr:mitochondrial Rho GTPase [Salix suchowensis]